MSDDDLERAIALSLKEAQAAGTSSQPISIDSDSDDGDDSSEDARFNANLQRALALSNTEPSDAPKAPSSAPQSASAPTPPATAAPTAPFMSERAQMEQARLERLKRLRPDLAAAATAAPVAPPPTKRARASAPPSSGSETESDSGAEGAPPRQRQRVSPPGAAPENGKGKGKAGADDGVLFWDAPELRQTANALVDRAKDTRPTWRLSEIIGPKQELAFALMASYCIDWPWLYEFFDPATPVIVVAQPDTSGNEGVKEVLPNWIKTTPFLRNGFGCMHMKFMLLFYKSGRLRVAINTGNSVPYDWRDIENTSWVQDVPRRTAPPPAPDARTPDFGAQFEGVLKALNVESALRTFRMNGVVLPLPAIADLRRTWDFSKVAARLVPSLAGKHEGWPAVIRTGHTALMKAVRDLGCAPQKGQALSIECQGSSIGQYSTAWTNEFVGACRGESPEAWLDAPRSRRTKLPHPPALKIVFPTARTVRQSRLGERGGGTLFCRPATWDAARFPRELFCDSRSKRGSVLMHSKMIIATLGASSGFAAGAAAKPPARGAARRKNAHDSDTDGSDVELVEPAAPAHGWAYVGSHNFTPSAWGTLSGSAFNPVLNVTNFELGVVFPLTDGAHAERVACWERPPPRYDLPRDRAWMQDESTAFAGKEAGAEAD